MKIKYACLIVAVLGIVMAALAPAQNTFRLMPESGGAFSSMVRQAPTYVDARVLAANVNEDHTVPTGAKWVLFSSDCNFYAKPGGTAAVPAADVTAGTGSEQNPTAWRIDDVTTIGMIAATACKVTLTFYK